MYETSPLTFTIARNLAMLLFWGGVSSSPIFGSIGQADGAGRTCNPMRNGVGLP